MVGDGQTLGDFSVDFFHDGRHSIKSLQRDAVVGHWDGHTLNLGGVGRMAAEHRSVVAADRAGVRDGEAAGGKMKRC